MNIFSPYPYESYEKTEFYYLQYLMKYHNEYSYLCRTLYIIIADCTVKVTCSSSFSDDI